ncbi:MAG: hypothetical protein QOJ92_841 [Frankiales bacterium]|nr:hypothetical protein [Frankiales bacterium]MDX6273631.1 hypothetical protein [Frankiales bacterium]
MATTTREMAVPAAAVWEVLRDGFSYGDWVVGTSTIRAVDEGFPAPGTRLHYRIGRGPVTFDDETEVTGLDEGRQLDLEARAWPVGTAAVTIITEDEGAVTRVSIEERPVRGVAARLHNPGADLLIKLRNVEVLRRLERLARKRVSDRA